MNDSGVVSRTDEVSWVGPDQGPEGILVTLLHSLPQLCSQVLGPGAAELISTFQVPRRTSPRDSTALASGDLNI